MKCAPRRCGVYLTAVCISGAALAPGRASGAEPDTEKPAAKPVQAAKPADEIKGEDIVVTGTRLPIAIKQLAQDVHVYGRQQIDASGQATISNFLATRPEVSLNSVESTFNGTTVRLRGVQVGSTLILINGRRTQGVTGGVAGSGFFDLNTIPLALVKRIEVLPTGSSAVYGGDALAGVVNIVLKSDFTGVTAEAGYRWADDTDEQYYSGGAGWKSGELSISIMGSYSKRNALLGRDRDITANPDMRRFGGPNLGSVFFGTPANVSSISGNLPGLGSSFASVPVGSSGVGLTPVDFLATAGLQNTGSFTQYSAALPKSHQWGLLANATYHIGGAAELFAELLASGYKSDIQFTPPFLALATIPASNPFNPFGTAVRVSGVVQGAEQSRIKFKQDLIRPLVGARGKVGAWHWEMTGLYSHDKGGQDVTAQPNGARLNAALASSDPSTALNPFTDGPMASPSLLASIYSGRSAIAFRTTDIIIDGFARGSLLKLPGGPLDAVAGAEYQHSSLKGNFEVNRTVKAAFAELRAPLLAVADGDRGRELLAVQLAGRYDDYSDFGSKATWQAGIEFRPWRSLALRGTHGTAFRPPTLYQIAAPPLSGTSTVSDPQRNGEVVVVQVATGGDPSLQPATGKSSTLGMAWSPSNPRLHLSLTYWWLDIEKAVVRPNPQFIVSNSSLYPGRVIRAAALPGEVGQVVSVDYSFVNFGAMRESGLDGSIDWTFSTGVGELTPAIAATYLTKFEGASTPGAPIVNRLSRANGDLIFAPRWKGIASIAWRPDQRFNLAIAGRYVGRYTDFTPPHRLGNFWYFDATLEVDLQRTLHLDGRPLRSLTLLISGTNIANKLPTYSTYFRGYDPSNYDLVGRAIFARLQTQF
jgi:iron complex outermembrane receptor protein